ncbi:High affinity Ca2+/Mn2+ P-type ATPase-like protein [Boothiomyces sp. JEL0866]|nr:High affinity Ca2+/Mn2+ P-type ATPase-like protein [Boothiomyces sp. JEL0866]
MVKKQTQHCLSQILIQHDCTTIGPQVLEEFENIFENYFNLITKQVMCFTELNNRTKPTWKDVLLAIEQVSSIKEIQAYILQELQLERVEDQVMETTAPPAPTLPPATCTFGTVLRDDSIPKHFPNYPPQHSFMETKLPLHPLSEDLKVRLKKIEQSTIIEQNLTKILQKSFKDDPFNEIMSHSKAQSPEIMEDSIKYSSKTPEECCQYLETTLTGLTSDQIPPRRVKYGPNEIELEEKETLLEKFIEQFKDPLILMLLCSALLSLLVGQVSDAISITMTIFIVMTVAFVQEYKSSQSIDALTKLAPPHCHVIRNGHTVELLASELVPGDVVKFSRGDRIPADCRLLESVSLEVDESNLTGETEPSRKDIKVIHSFSTDLSFAERTNLVFMGTLVRNGHGTAVVFGTANKTELGSVLRMVSEVDKPKTPLQLKMDELGKHLSFFSFVLIAIISLLGIIQGKEWLEVFQIAGVLRLTSVSLAVAAIPEGLPVVVAVTLALGVLRMTTHNAIVKKLPSVESLGSVNVVCIDKTGTITANKMVATLLVAAADKLEIDIENYSFSPQLNHPVIKRLLSVGNICNNSYYDEEGVLNGQPTEVAIMEFFTKARLEDERKYHTRLSEIPFNPEVKWMAVESSNQVESLYYVKGAIESVLAKCTHYMHGNSVKSPITEIMKQEFLDYESKISSNGLRILTFAVGAELDSLTLIGFIGVYDPPRPQTVQTIEKLNDAGIHVIMITGDSYGTAKAIAEQVGIKVKHTSYSGNQLDAMSFEELKSTVLVSSLYYRTTPTHKLKIVEALQAGGNIVAMTGDGGISEIKLVNDAPALSLADIGVSMGNGTDVAKEAADMILVDDNLGTIIYAIDEGKNIFYNIKNFLTFQLCTSLAALMFVAICSLFGLPNPLNAMQILWINIICDGPVAQSLGVEPMDPVICAKPPRKKDEPILTNLLLVRVITNAIVIVVGTLTVFIHEEFDDGLDDRTRTMVQSFTLIVLFALWNSLSCRSEARSIFSKGFITNQMYNYALSLVLFGQILVVHFPFLNSIFLTEPLSIVDWLYLFALSSVVFWIEELRKWYTIRQASQNNLAYSRLL